MAGTSLTPIKSILEAGAFNPKGELKAWLSLVKRLRLRLAKVLPNEYDKGWTPPREWTEAFRAAANLALGLAREGRELDKLAAAKAAKMNHEEVTAELHRMFHNWLKYLPEETKKAIVYGQGAGSA